jgi:hypothetical protein
MEAHISKHMLINYNKFYNASQILYKGYLKLCTYIFVKSMKLDGRE